MQADQYDFGLEEPFLQFQSEERFLLKGALHMGAEWEWDDSFFINPSVAAQIPMSWGELSLEPRLRTSYRPGGSENTKFTAGGGYYYQFISGISDERDAGSSFQVWTPTPFENHPLQAIHGLLGWNQRLLPSLHLSLEGWYKKLQNLPVPEWTPVARFNTNLVRADGTAFGADFSAQYERGPLRLSLTYGYGQITYHAARSTLGGWVDEPVVEYTPPHDLRHKVGLTASIDVNQFTAGVKWEYSSGLPMTKVYGFDTMLEIRGLRDLPFQDVGTPRALYNRPYSSRLPAYHRLDVSLERQFDLSPTLGLTTEAGAINAYDRANVFYVDIYSLDRVDQLPVLPYLTFQLTFN
jgi:hypothetical protein